jgi:hypothetical protein
LIRDGFGLRVDLRGGPAMKTLDPLRSAVRSELAGAGDARDPSNSRSARRRRAGTALAVSLAAALALVGARAAGAAGPFRHENLPGLAGLDAGDHSQPALADLDADGDLDLAVGEDQGTLLTFFNVGSSSAPAFLQATGTASPFAGLDAGDESAAALADLDADGDFDAVVGREAGTFLYLQNTGSPSAGAFVSLTGTANPFSGFDVGGGSTPGLGDLDGDGDLDAVSGESNGTLRYFRNTGASTAPSFVEVLGTGNPFLGFDAGTQSSPALADVDGDGDLDVAVGFNGTASLRYLRNDGSSSAPQFVDVGVGTDNPFDGIILRLRSTPALADTDGDFDLDVVVGDTDGKFSYLLNNGASSAPAYVDERGAASPISGPDVGSRAKPVLADLDGDGDLDAVVGEGSGLLFYFENTGSAAAPAYEALTGPANPFDGFDSGIRCTVGLGDVDGDGDLDAVAGDNAGTFHYLENSGSSSAPAFAELTGGANPFDGLNPGFNSTPALADVDADGDLDMVAGHYYGTLHLYRNTGSSAAPAFVEVTGTANAFGVPMGEESAPTLVDVDGDGDLDVVVPNSTFATAYLVNTGTPTAPAFVAVTGAANPFDADFREENNAGLAVADLDDDGDLDLLLGDSTGQMLFWRSLANVFADGFESGDTSAWSLAVP